jgi:hypothetical protein
LFGAAAAASGVAGIEEKNGGAPWRAAMVPTVKLGCAAVVGPARPGVEVAAVKEEMAAGLA